LYPILKSGGSFDYAEPEWIFSSGARRDGIRITGKIMGIHLPIIPE
jgi:hypothetical protein